MQGGSAKKTKKNVDKTTDKTVVDKTAEASGSKATDEPPQAKITKIVETGNYFANVHLNLVEILSLINLSFNKENVTNIVVLEDGTVEETIIVNENGKGDESTPMNIEEGEIPENTSKKLVKVNLN